MAKKAGTIMAFFEEDELPDAYKRLMAAQRQVSPEEAQEIEREQHVESQRNRIRRRLAKVY